MSSRLTFPLFSVDCLKNVEGRLRTQTVTSQCAWIDQLVKVVDHPCVLNRFLNSFFKLALKIRMFLHYKKKKKSHIVRRTIKISQSTGKKRHKRQTHQYEGSST